MYRYSNSNTLQSLNNSLIKNIYTYKLNYDKLNPLLIIFYFHLQANNIHRYIIYLTYSLIPVFFIIIITNFNYYRS